MAVEIVILSGSRQGEQLYFEGEQFRVGDEPACEIYFNPALDPGARGRMVVFRRREEGWSALPLGSPGLLLDYDPLADAAPIRSGQVVRMSADGPDFSFRVVAAAEVPQPARPTPIAAVPSVPPPPSPMIPAPVLSTLAAAAAGPALPAPTRARPTVSSVPILVLVGIGLGALMLAVTWWLIRTAGGPWPATSARETEAVASGENTGSVRPPSPPTPLPQAGEGSSGASSPPSMETAAPTAPASSTEAPPAADPPKPPAADPLEPVKKALYLLVVEQTLSDGSAMAYPQATCCALSDKELLTTGNVGCELLRFRAQKYKIYVARPDEQVKLPVAEIRIRTDFIQRETDRQARRYCDLALLSVEGRLPTSAPIAGRKDLGPPRLEEGMRFRLLGYPHDGNKITAHDHFPIESFEAKVFMIRAREPQTAGTPLCLDLVGRLPENAYGFGVFTEDGKLLGLYNELPGEEETRGVKNLHVITAVHPEPIEKGLRARDERLWVEPRVVDTSAKEGKR